MAERAIPQHKRMAMGEKPQKYAKGGMVVPRSTPTVGGLDVAVPRSPLTKVKMRVPPVESKKKGCC